MKKVRTLYKTLGCYSNEEIDSLKEDIIDWLDQNDEDHDDEAIDDEMYHSINEGYNDLMDNIKYSNINKARYVINGTLGLWDGIKVIYPHECNSLTEAIFKCIDDMDDFIITDNNGRLEIEVMHHDGTNRFVIHRLVGNRKVNVNLRSII